MPWLPRCALLCIAIRQGEPGHGKSLPAGERGVVYFHITAAARGRYRALYVRRGAIAGINAEMSRRARSVGAGIFPRTALGLAAR